MGFGQLIILLDRELHLMTSNTSTSPLVDIIQGHFWKSFEALKKIVGYGWWLNMNVIICWQLMRDPTVLMSVVTGCK